MLKVFLQQWLLKNRGSDLLRCRKNVVVYQKWQIIKGWVWGPRKQKLKIQICCSINYPNTFWLLANSHLWLRCVKYLHNSQRNLNFRIAWTLLSTPEGNFGVYFTVRIFISQQPTQFCSPTNQPTQKACCFSDFIIYDRSLTVLVSIPLSVYGYTHTLGTVNVFKSLY